MNADKHTLIIK